MNTDQPQTAEDKPYLDIHFWVWRTSAGYDLQIHIKAAHYDYDWITGQTTFNCDSLGDVERKVSAAIFDPILKEMSKRGPLS